ncbi:LuxR C-terminal-related transcriptional regulator [Paenibacillus sp. MSJ-34]|uniref:LuxR C-terminal-related transcriptional regulator n=1 Tax=Paenibacillus sp. MSJ-34 TaxID=2841529 RepID=UPI001C1155BA|nr:LuxR C-terminal-related transcriptional regulator [Paenibacillus sp. MSJ-34]MBU5445388.1 LuxR C-terminal-related transcriptional regulator [Paenibacillus sp. MSJ-34]
MIISTKLHIPRTRAALVERTRLFARLDEGLQCPLTLVAAPPGYGKTTLLSEWSATIDSAAWVSLDKGDNEPARFWMLSISALANVFPAFDGQAALRYAEIDLSGYSTVAALLNELNRMQKRAVLIWDDFHEIFQVSMIEQISYFIDRLPPCVHLYIASRTLPPLALSRLRMKGGLVQLGTDDLRFSREETAEFFGSTSHGPELSPSETEEILERAEGWVAGMQLACMSWGGAGRRPGVTLQLTGSHRLISDYFFEEVLSRQTETMKHFLLRTSLLDRMNGPLCEAVTGMKDSSLCLQELERANLFLIPLDERREWYRYHHLFQQFLQMQWKREGEDRFRVAHMAAAGWFERHCMPQEAIEHYLAGAYYEEALRIVEGIVPTLKSSEWMQLHLWLNAIPDSTLFEKPKLFIANAASLFLSGEVEPATEKYWWAANRLEQAEALPSNVRKEYEAGLAFLVAFRYFLEQDFETSIQYAARYVRIHPEGDFFVGFGSGQDGYHPIWDVHASAGGLVQAEQALSALLAIWSETRNVYFIAHLCIDFGRLQYERNRLDEAERYFRRSLELGRTHENLSLTVLSSLWIARVYTADGRWELAESVVRLLNEQVQESGSNRMLAGKIRWFEAQRMRMQGDGERAAAWVLEGGMHAGDEISGSMIEEYDLLVCSLAAYGRATEAEALTDRLLDIVDRVRSQGAYLRLLIRKSLLLAQKQNMAQSLHMLERALALAEPEGYIRSFVDEGKPLRKLLASYLKSRQNNHRRGNRNVSLSYVKRLLRSMYNSRLLTELAEMKEYHFDSLTAQETNVLQLIHAGLTNQEIASRLQVSLSTVKTHINNLYRKLHVDNRILAVQRAKQLELL